VKSRAQAGQLSIIGVGAGPGLHVQEAIVQSGIDPRQVQAYLIDRDSDAFEYGRQCARDRGIENCVSFVQGDAREIRRVLPDVAPQIVKVVGLLEYLTDAQAVDLLRALREVMVSGGQILTHGIVDRYNTAPFVARTFGLKHVYRTANQVQDMLESVGFGSVEMCEEPLKIYPILVAKR
jgi:ubiquinone/menaquinone biosynthesis C-methylase UbiE